MAVNINRSALVLYSAERMFELVNDVASYPQFLPWCSKTEVLSHTDKEMLAALEISKGAIKQKFTTRNRLNYGQVIQMQLEEGPFRYLSGQWEFIALREDASKVVLTLEFEIGKGLAQVAFGKVFSQVANSMVEAFCNRARQIYE